MQILAVSKFNLNSIKLFKKKKGFYSSEIITFTVSKLK